MKKNKQKKNIKEFYDQQSDVKWYVMKDGEESYYRELSPGINVEFNDEDEVIGIEILDFSKKLIPDMILTSSDSETFEEKVDLDDAKNINKNYFNCQFF